jgi:hypothetical protein
MEEARLCSPLSHPRVVSVDTADVVVQNEPGRVGALHARGMSDMAVKASSPARFAFGRRERR